MIQRRLDPKIYLFESINDFIFSFKLVTYDILNVDVGKKHNHTIAHQNVYDVQNALS